MCDEGLDAECDIIREDMLIKGLDVMFTLKCESSDICAAANNAKPAQLLTPITVFAALFEHSSQSVFFSDFLNF